MTERTTDLKIGLSSRGIARRHALGAGTRDYQFRGQQHAWNEDAWKQIF
jgi:hypothetical protein